MTHGDQAAVLDGADDLGEAFETAEPYGDSDTGRVMDPEEYRY